ncbi:rhodanese-like domain-containing protein [uncultured Desulfuromonas sp.]|uniref:rhodanese-like domain-containing protein n=1 Tax=uncultured Desulfuromonas sp. TaxID=181013 RepID=UPI00262F7F79|nr:rhodanese-like domain-containing protein [uncultured Desulfuromonas sp.]
MPHKKQTTLVLVLLTLFFALALQAQAGDQKDPGYQIIYTSQLKALFDSGGNGFLIIDARNPGEYAEVHIPGAINVPEKKFDEHAHLLPESRATQLIFYCNGVKCGKSKKAAAKALALGYTNVHVYAEGMPVWEEVEFPLIKGPDYEKPIEADIIAPEELNAWIASDRDDFTLVDVRDTEEFALGHIPGAVNIPVATFAAQSGTLDKKKTIVVYCNGGGRSNKAYRKVMNLGYKKYRQALFTDWKNAGFEVAL